MLAVTE